MHRWYLLVAAQHLFWRHGHLDSQAYDGSQIVGSGCLNAQPALTRAFLLTPPSSTILSGLRSNVVEIVGHLIGFQTVDGSGIVIVNGVPIPVGPWGPRVGEYVQKSDILVSLAVEELATHINNVESQVTVREAALNAARAQIEPLLTKLGDSE